MKHYLSKRSALVLLSLIVTLFSWPQAMVQAVTTAECLASCYPTCESQTDFIACESACDPSDSTCLNTCADLILDCNAGCDRGCAANSSFGSSSDNTTSTGQNGTSLQPPFGGAEAQTEPIIIIAVVIQALLGLVGAGALLMFVWGGFHLIFSGGAEERITKGKKILIWAVVGMIVVLSSYAVLNFTFDIFKTASGA